MTLNAHPSTQIVKCLVIGDSGTGKTGALASLANAGYKLRIWDYDNGLDVLRGFVTKENRANVSFVTLSDDVRFRSGRASVRNKEMAFVRGTKLFENWVAEYENPEDPDNPITEELGSIYDWGPQDVAVIDSMTFMCQAAMTFVTNSVARFGVNAQIQDWGEAIRKSEETLQLLYGPSCGANVVVTSHITYIGGGDDDPEPPKAYPSALGQKLPPKVGRYFNTMVGMTTSGHGSGLKRKIRTISTPKMEYKNPMPNLVPAELDIKDGLAKLFEIIKKGE